MRQQPPAELQPVDDRAPVGLGRQIVRMHRRRRRRVGDFSLMLAAAFRTQLVDDHREAGPFVQPLRGPVGAEDRRSTNCMSGVASSGRVRANRPPGAAAIVSGPRAEQRVFQPGFSIFQRLSMMSLTVIGKRHLQLDAAPVVVLQALRRRPAGRARTAMPCAARCCGRADARQQQKLRRVDRAAAQDHLARARARCAARRPGGTRRRSRACRRTAPARPAHR